IREEPKDDHGGEIERGDGGDDSERLTNLHLIHAGSHVLEDVALHHHGDATGNFHVLDAAAQLGFRFGKSFSVLDGDETGELIEIFFKEVFQLEEILDALAWRGAAPRWEGS